jgi:hypothetical protein
LHPPPPAMNRLNKCRRCLELLSVSSHAGISVHSFFCAVRILATDRSPTPGILRNCYGFTFRNEFQSGQNPCNKITRDRSSVQLSKASGLLEAVLASKICRCNICVFRTQLFLQKAEGNRS